MFFYSLDRSHTPNNPLFLNPRILVQPTELPKQKAAGPSGKKIKIGVELVTFVCVKEAAKMWL